MSNSLSLEVFNRQRLTSLLGLALDGSRLDGVVLRRVNGSVEVLQTFSVTLSLDPLTNDPELVGREIRNHLNAAGVRERRCVFGLPLKWALTSHIEMPELEEKDVEGFLQLEAERVFPCDPATLVIATSRYKLESGKAHATLIGIPRNHIEVMENVLRAAQLKAVSFSLGHTALQPAPAQASNGVLALEIGGAQVGLQITCGGGVAALRALEGALENQGGAQPALLTDVVAREVRITFGQLPGEIRSQLKVVRVFGQRDLAQQLADELELRFEALDLKVEVVSTYPAGEFGVQLPANVAVSAAFSLATGTLVKRPGLLEFLPPRVSPWKQMSTRMTSGRLRTAGLAAAAVLLVVIGAFGWQQWQLHRYEAKWKQMERTVHDLEDMQQHIVQFRPWFDESLRSLTILRAITSAFPEDGAVSAKSVEIRDPNIVSCSGVARDNRSFLRMYGNLRAVPEVKDLKVDRIQGRSPMQFTFDFHWVQGGQP